MNPNDIMKELTDFARKVNNIDKFEKKYKKLFKKDFNIKLKKLREERLSGVRNEIVGEVLKSVNFTELQEKLKRILKSKEEVKIGELKKVRFSFPKIERVDEENLMNMYMNYDEENIKEFKTYLTLFNDNVEDVIVSLRDFDEKVKNDEEKLRKFIAEDLVNYLFDVHVDYIRKIMKKDNVDVCALVLNTKVPFNKSQKKFISDGIKLVVENLKI